MKIDPRPTNCRERLRDEGRSYPRTGCAACNFFLGKSPFECREPEIAAELAYLRQKVSEYESYSNYNGYGLMLNDAGEPDECKKCGDETVVPKENVEEQAFAIINKLTTTFGYVLDSLDIDPEDVQITVKIKNQDISLVKPGAKINLDEIFDEANRFLSTYSNFKIDL